VIVDDDAEGLDAFADRLIQPTFAEGLTAEQATHAMALLGQSSDESLSRLISKCP
jgi:hypothetical protein